MQEKLNWRLIFVAIMLMALSLGAYYYWGVIKYWISSTLKSEILTVIIWIFLTTVLAIHFYIYRASNVNVISDKDGLEKPLDYLQFTGTYGVILTFAKTFSCEFFLQWNFPGESQCSNLGFFDKICMISCVFVLINYSFYKIWPVLEDIFIKKVSIQA